MQKATQSRGGDAQKATGDPGRSRGRQVLAPTGHLAQLAAIMNSPALTQLKLDIECSPVVQNLIRLGEQIAPNSPADSVQLMPAGTLAHSDRVDLERDVEREESHEQSSAGSSGGCGSAQKKEAQSGKLDHPGAIVQKYDMDYGGLHHDSGTDMWVRIDGASDPDIGSGSQKTITPNWWPTTPAETQPVVDYMNKYIKQGHLLNADIGGPGNKRKNLTPITGSTNTTHFTQIEDTVKKLVQADNIVEYRVIPDYSQQAEFANLGNNPPAGVAKYCAYMPYAIAADYTYYDKNTGTKLGGLPGEKLIKNEGPQKKGKTF